MSPRTAKDALLAGRLSSASSASRRRRSDDPRAAGSGAARPGIARSELRGTDASEDPHDPSDDAQLFRDAVRDV